MGMTTAGREWYTDKVQNVAPLSNALRDFLGWGTGTNAEAVGDVQLQTEASEARVQGTLSQPTTTTDRLVATITANGAKNISEMGRFNKTDNNAGRVLQQRHVFTAIPLLLGDRVEGTLDTLD